MDQALPPQVTQEETGPIADLLWFVRILAKTFAMVFGLPSKIADSYALIRPLRNQCLFWLRGMEAVARRILFLRAAQLPPPLALAPALETKSRRRPKSGAGGINVAAEDSTLWRVRFAIIGSIRSARAANPAASARSAAWLREAPERPLWLHHARPIAERFESLLRVIADPDLYAAKLCARLHALQHKGLIGRLSAAIAKFRAPPRTPRGEARPSPDFTSLRDTQSEADAAAARFAAVDTS